jgi:hypothetical protein
MQESHVQNETSPQVESLTLMPTGYDFVVATIKGFGSCARWKDLDIEFGEHFDNLPQIIETALERGDLVRPSIGCVCGPEIAELAHPANYEEEWSDDIPF